MSSARPDAVLAVKPIDVSADLKALMRRLKLGQLLVTLPERLALPARTGCRITTSWRCCWPMRSSAVTAIRPIARQGRTSGPADAATLLGRHRRSHLRSTALVGADLAAVSRRRLQRAHYGTCRSRKNVPGPRLRTHRRAASPQHTYRTRRQTV